VSGFEWFLIVVAYMAPGVMLVSFMASVIEGDDGPNDLGFNMLLMLLAALWPVLVAVGLLTLVLGTPMRMARRLWHARKA
jgi:Na+/proline symporter